MALAKYVVQRTNISLGHGKKVKEGEIVEIDAKTAKHYAKLGFLAPYIPDDDEDEDDDDNEPEGHGESDILGRTTARPARMANTDAAPERPSRPVTKPL